MALTDNLNREISKIYGEIAANFTIKQIPEGGAPESIRQEWVGITMPVRTFSLGSKAMEACSYFDALTFTVIDNPEPVTIVGMEAVEALKEAGKNSAAEFWLPFGLAEFVFRGYEGDLVPHIDPLRRS